MTTRGAGDFSPALGSNSGGAGRGPTIANRGRGEPRMSESYTGLGNKAISVL
jgi:hypothetical protein